MENQLVQAIVAVHDARFVSRRHMLRQPVDETVHRLDGARLARLVLLAPAANLAREVVAGLAVVGQSSGRDIDLVQLRQHPVHPGELDARRSLLRSCNEADDDRWEPLAPAPHVDAGAFVANTAVLHGRVAVADGASIWYGC